MINKLNNIFKTLFYIILCNNSYVFQVNSIFKIFTTPQNICDSIIHNLHNLYIHKQTSKSIKQKNYESTYT